MKTALSGNEEIIMSEIPFSVPLGQCAGHCRIPYNEKGEMNFHTYFKMVSSIQDYLGTLSPLAAFALKFFVEDCS